MTYNAQKVSKYCDEMSDKYGAGECEKHCTVADLCERCGGDFDSLIDNDTTYADRAVERLDKSHADDVANSVLVEYYKKELEARDQEIAALKEINKILAESIKNLSAKG